MIDKNKLGLTLGILFALLHALWSLAILVTQTGMQKFIDWIMILHSLSMAITIIPFNLVNALILVAFTFVSGYVTGWIFAAIMNSVKKK